MTKVIGVRFRQAGKIYFFAPGKYHIEEGEHVIVETARGVEYGHVVLSEREVEDDKVIQPLKAVIRPATVEDDEREAKNREKDLASVFKTRIELRQIGVRDEAKIRGGIGVCGRPLCCATYMPEFVPVSIKMAKEQNLSLNPTKISGVCGRLMCCLKNEQDTYEELNSKLPNVGDIVTTFDKLKGEVSSVSVLRQRVKVIVNLDNDEKEVREYAASELRFKPKKRVDKALDKNSLKELEELEKLEKKEGKSHINDD